MNLETHENIHFSIKQQLEQFYKSKKIPHIIFHGASGTGKRTLVHWFLNRIYSENKSFMKSNIMLVNCAHGKGIKFIREELKFFAKSNIQSNQGVLFKTIVLLNADFLTIDAQSALRRCIELFSNNTRFFIIVENKNKLLNPILSRFCEIYIPETISLSTKEIVNLHHLSLSDSLDITESLHLEREILEKYTQSDFTELSIKLYNDGYSCLDIIEWIKSPKSGFSEFDISKIVLCFDKIRPEYRCERLLMLYMFNYIFLRSNSDLKDVGFI